jgi:hypothetical protein
LIDRYVVFDRGIVNNPRNTADIMVSANVSNRVAIGYGGVMENIPSNTADIVFSANVSRRVAIGYRERINIPRNTADIIDSANVSRRVAIGYGASADKSRNTADNVFYFNSAFAVIDLYAKIFDLSVVDISKKTNEIG